VDRKENGSVETASADVFVGAAFFGSGRGGRKAFWKLNARSLRWGEHVARPTRWKGRESGRTRRRKA